MARVRQSRTAAPPATHGGNLLILATIVVVTPLALISHVESRLYVNAETLYVATIERNPSAWLAYNNLGVQKMDSAPADAAGYFRQALALNPDSYDAHYNLGYSLLLAGRTDEAIPHLRDAIRLKPRFAEAHDNLGTALVRRGQLAEAEQQYREALGWKPGLAGTHTNLGNVFYLTGRYQEAIAEYQIALGLNPASSEARAALARAQAAIGR